MNNKILSVVLVVGIATTGFAGISAANSSTGSVFGNKAEIQSLMQKIEAGETLSVDEQATLDEAKANRGEKGAKHGGKRKGGGNLTDEEKTALESMSDDEKQAFFDAKKAEMTAQKDAHKAIIDALIAGDTLTAEQETTRLEMIAKMSENDGNHKRAGSEIIAKILAGDELTADEQTELADMQTQRAERDAEKAIIEPIKEKLKAGETLSDEEQAVLDDHKANAPEGKGHGRGEGKGGRR